MNCTLRWPALEDDGVFEQALTYALRAIGKGDIQLKAAQKNALRCLFRGEDVFLWLPTGFGKSIILPYLSCSIFKLKRTSNVHNRSTVVVVSPLISLMTEVTLPQNSLFPTPARIFLGG